MTINDTGRDDMRTTELYLLPFASVSLSGVEREAAAPRQGSFLFNDTQRDHFARHHR